MKVNLLVLNFNGKDLLGYCLPSLLLAAKKSSNQCTVTVIDNASTDESVAYLKSHFPQVQLISAKENRVLCSYNEVIEASCDDIVILLNNDIKVDEYFIDPLVSLFGVTEDVFLVAPKMLNLEGEAEGAETKAYIKGGVFWASARYPGYERAVDRQGETFASGMGAFDRRKFVDLGGYDALYLPGTLEDSDICFRAWRKGWRCLYEPKSIIVHIGQVSFKRRFGKSRTACINSRNVFLFMWKNLSSRSLLMRHLFFLPLRLCYAVVTGNFAFIKGFMQALEKSRDAFKRRKQMKTAERKRSDEQIFNQFKIR